MNLSEDDLHAAQRMHLPLAKLEDNDDTRWLVRKLCEMWRSREAAMKRCSDLENRPPSSLPGPNVAEALFRLVGAVARLIAHNEGTEWSQLLSSSRSGLAHRAREFAGVSGKFYLEIIRGNLIDYSEIEEELDKKMIPKPEAPHD